MAIYYMERNNKLRDKIENKKIPLKTNKEDNIY